MGSSLRCLISAVALLILSLIFDEMHIILGLATAGLLFWRFFLKRFERNRQSFFIAMVLKTTPGFLIVEWRAQDRSVCWIISRKIF